GPRPRPGRCRLPSQRRSAMSNQPGDERLREERRRRDAARAARRGAEPRIRPSGASGGNADRHTAALVSIIMGSDSDYDVMRAAAEALAEFEVPCEVRVVSAHRTPLDMAGYAQDAAGRGLKVIIAGAGGAAHL